MLVWHTTLWSTWRACFDFIFSGVVPKVDEVVDTIKNVSWLQRKELLVSIMSGL